MTTPTGFLQSLTTALKRLARKGDVVLCKGGGILRGKNAPSAGQAGTHRCKARAEGKLERPRNALQTGGCPRYGQGR